MFEYIILLAVFFIGYLVGRRDGWQNGFAQAEAVAPLRLRQQSMEHGQCILCKALPLQSIVELKDDKT